MDSHQKRKILMFKDNIDKIIENGIKPNLQKLQKSSKLIKLNNSKDHSKTRLLKECMNARLTIQQLRKNLIELEKCYFAFKELCIDANYDEMILSVRKNVLREIDTFIKTNGEIDCKLYNQDDDYIVNSSANTENFQIQSQNLDIENDKLSKAKQNFKEVQSINKDLEELYDLMLKFCNLVHEQQSQVDNIEENIEIAVECVEEGNKSLAKAASLSIAPIACAAIGASIFGPIGAIVSFKISTGIASALGGSVLTYSLASYVKNKKDKQIEFDDTDRE